MRACAVVLDKRLHCCDRDAGNTNADVVMFFSGSISSVMKLRVRSYFCTIRMEGSPGH